MTKVALIAALAALIIHGTASRAQETQDPEPAAESPTPDEVGAEEEEPSDAFALPSATMGALTLQPVLGAGFAYFTQNNSWYGRSTANLGRNSDRWVEGYVRPGFGATLDLSEAGRVRGGISVVGTFTRGTDAAGTNVDENTPTDWPSTRRGWVGTRAPCSPTRSARTRSTSHSAARTSISARAS